MNGWGTGDGDSGSDRGPEAGGRTFPCRFAAASGWGSRTQRARGGTTRRIGMKEDSDVRTPWRTCSARSPSPPRVLRSARADPGRPTHARTPGGRCIEVGSINAAWAAHRADIERSSPTHVAHPHIGGTEGVGRGRRTSASGLSAELKARPRRGRPVNLAAARTARRIPEHARSPRFASAAGGEGGWGAPGTVRLRVRSPRRDIPGCGRHAWEGWGASCAKERTLEGRRERMEQAEVLLDREGAPEVTALFALAWISRGGASTRFGRLEHLSCG